MTHQDALPQLIDALRTLFVRGLPQNDEAAQCIEAFIGDFDPETLTGLLANRDSADAATVAELLLFPTTQAMADLEPLLEEARCTTADARTVILALAASLDQTEAIFPNGMRIPVTLKTDDLDAFVTRLKPVAHPPDELAALLNARLPHAASVALKVQLRHARLEWTPARLFFVATLLRRHEVKHGDLHALLAFSLELLDLSGPHLPPQTVVGDRHRDLTAQLKAAEQFEELRAKSNYETMMMQGARFAQPHVPSLRAALAMLDALARTMFDRAAGELEEPRSRPPDGVTERDLGDFMDMDALLRAWDNPDD